MAYRLRLGEDYDFPESLTYNLVSFRSAVPSAKLPRAHGARVPLGSLDARRIEVRGLLKTIVGGESLQEQLDGLRAAVMAGPQTLYLPNDRHLRDVQKDDNGADRFDNTWPERMVDVALDFVTGDPHLYSDEETEDLNNALGGEEEGIVDTFTDPDLTPLQSHSADTGENWQKYDNGITSPLDLLIWTGGPTSGAVVHDPADFPDSGNAYSGAIYYIENTDVLLSYTLHVDIVIDPHPGDSDWDWGMTLIANLHPTSSSVVSGHFLEINYLASTDEIQIVLVAIDPSLSGTNLTPGGGSYVLPNTATVDPDFRISLQVTESGGDYNLKVLLNGTVLNDGIEGDFDVDDTSGDIATGGDFGIQVHDLGWTTFMGTDKIGGFIDRFSTGVAVEGPVEVILNNADGNAPAAPELRFTVGGTGAVTIAATVTNETTGEAFTLAGIVAGGDVIKVNSLEKTVLIGATDRSDLFNGIFPTLAIGNNTFTIVEVSGLFTNLDAYWRHRWY